MKKVKRFEKLENFDLTYTLCKSFNKNFKNISNFLCNSKKFITIRLNLYLIIQEKKQFQIQKECFKRLNNSINYSKFANNYQLCECKFETLY